MAYLITTPRFIIRVASNLILKQHLYLAIFSEKQPEIHTSISFYCHGLLSSLSFSTREEKQTTENPCKGILFWVCLSPSPARPMGNELILPGGGQAASGICLLHNLSSPCSRCVGPPPSSASSLGTPAFHRVATSSWPNQLPPGMAEHRCVRYSCDCASEERE